VPYVQSSNGSLPSRANIPRFLRPETLPDNQQDSALAETLRAIIELDLSELQAIEPPRGFGRD
jgi:hypothetical protein